MAVTVTFKSTQHGPRLRWAARPSKVAARTGDVLKRKRQHFATERPMSILQRLRCGGDAAQCNGLNKAPQAAHVHNTHALWPESVHFTCNIASNKGTSVNNSVPKKGTLNNHAKTPYFPGEENMNYISIRSIRSFFALGCALLAVTATARGEDAPKLPKTMIWSTYDVGSAGYAEASAIANALGQKFGTQIRILPSGSGIGRLQPLLKGRADFGFLATEAFFVSEGIYDFAKPDWGPTQLRTLGGRPASISMVTAADANIHAIADAKGKRAAFVAGNPSVNIKCEAILAFGGLTLDDVKVVMFPTYAAAMSSMTKNESDFTCTTPTTSQLYELAESPRGIRWIPLDQNNAKGWAAMRKVLPIMQPFEEDIAAGLKKGEKVMMAAYRYPVVTTTKEKSADEVYAFIKALDETYDLYKSGTATMGRWSLAQSGHPPIDLPFHEGAIRYLKEKGIWTPQDEAWNEARIKRLDALVVAWKAFLPSHASLPADEFAKAWHAHRDETVATLAK